MKKGVAFKAGAELFDSWNKSSPACGFFTQITYVALRSPYNIRRTVEVLGHHSVFFVTLFFFFLMLLIKQVLVNASEGELLRTVSFIGQFWAPWSLVIFLSVSVQRLATEKNEGGDRGESGAAFSVRVKLADSQLLPHPNYRLCGVALGAEMRAGFASERALLRHSPKDTWVFCLGVHPQMAKEPGRTLAGGVGVQGVVL